MSTESTSFSVGSINIHFDTYESVKSISDEIKKLSKVTSIDLSGNTYGIEASKAISEILVLDNVKDSLNSINFADIFTGRLKEEIPESLTYLLPALLKCPKLNTIDLSDNAFGLVTVGPLEDFLSKHVPLKNLILENNGLGPNAGSRIGKALTKLANAKKESKSDIKLEKIVCGRNRLENGSMEAWSEALSTHKYIKELRLKQNGIRQEGIELLMEKGLSYCPDIERLDLQDNTFTVKGSRALVKELPKWTKLVELAISDCLLSSKGGRLLGQALIDVPVPTLEILRLQFNEIDSKGVKLIFNAIKENLSKLQTLELNGNYFSEDDSTVEEITNLFEERGFGELDELEDMEEPSDEEDEEDEEVTVLAEKVDETHI